MRVVVIGTGHVGLVTSATLAELGHEVVGTDADTEKIQGLQRGVLPFHEPGLSELVDRHASSGRLVFTEDPSGVYPEADVVFVCVSTPPRVSGEANLVAVEHAVREIGRHVAGRTVVVEKSTVPAGTADRVRRTLAREASRSRGEVAVVSNPEFLREGSAVQDNLQPDRILVGAEEEWAFGVMRELYAPLIERGVTLIETDISTAELAKHASNAFLALKISYANALARMCERAGADVTAVADVMGADPRVGRAFLDAGLGYGGSCFPKDLQAFERLATQLHYDFPLLREIARLNEEALEATVDKIRDALWNLEDKTIAILGLAFKPGTDDVRFSPALALAARLIEEGANVVGHDPHAGRNAKDELRSLEIAADAYQAADRAHCLVVATGWAEFAALDLERVRELMAYPVIVDARNVLDPRAVREAGLSYYPIGRPAHVV